MDNNGNEQRGQAGYRTDYVFHNIIVRLLFVCISTIF